MDFTALISKYFTLHEILWLPQYHRHADSSDGLTDEILETLKWFCREKADAVREFFGLPLVIAPEHCFYRPPAYNKLVGGALHSAHQALKPRVAAMDFHVAGMPCLTAKKRILQGGILKQLNLRMEDRKDTDPWLHLDSEPLLAGHSRFFKP